MNSTHDKTYRQKIHCATFSQMEKELQKLRKAHARYRVRCRILGESAVNFEEFFSSKVRALKAVFSKKNKPSTLSCGCWLTEFSHEFDKLYPNLYHPSYLHDLSIKEASNIASWGFQPDCIDIYVY